VQIFPRGRASGKLSSPAGGKKCVLPPSPARGLAAVAAFVPGDYVEANPGRRTGVAPVSDFEFLAWNERFADLTPIRLKMDPFLKMETGATPVRRR